MDSRPPAGDPEKASSSEDLKERSSKSEFEPSATSAKSTLQRWTKVLGQWGVETHGVDPVPIEDRTDKRLRQLFFVWFSGNMNIGGFSVGTIGPLFFGFGLRDSLLVYLLTNLIVAIFPAILLTFGPRLGMRGIVQSRFAFGYYGAKIPSVFNTFSQMGYTILVCIISGQCLATVNSSLNATLGVVLAGICTFALSFCGYQALHWFCSYAWLPNMILFIIMLGVGGNRLTLENPAMEPHDGPSFITFASVVAGSALGVCPLVADYGVYHDAKAPIWKLILYPYLGLFSATFMSAAVGAAFAASSLVVPEWEAGNTGDIGQLILVVLAPSGGFAKFAVVVAALVNISSSAVCLYTFGNSFMTILSVFQKVPRFMYTCVGLAILIPVGIVGAANFYDTLTSILSFVGYWAVIFAGIVLCEHIVFRKCDFSRYDVSIWNSPSKLPVGIAGIAAFCTGIAMMVLSMEQSYFTGPIAHHTGDTALLTGFFGAFIVYAVVRTGELAMFKR